jgi:hypothetical protein
VFTRSGSTWTQAGAALTPSDQGAVQAFGTAVAASSDGSTLLIGGGGAVWAFARWGSIWTQQGSAITPSEAPDASAFGASLGLSAAGDTAVIGAPQAGVNDAGGAWIYTRWGSTWTEGPALTVAGADALAEFGSAVALSGDGSTALLGSALQGNLAGGVAQFDRSGSAWTPVSSPIAPSDAAGAAQFGSAVALSGDGSTAFVGGPGDETQGGAAWAFSAQTPPVVTTQPVNETVTAPAAATFTAAASGDPAPTVQWQASTDHGVTWANIPGATSTTLTVTPTSVSLSGDEARAVFTNSQGTATTNAATLTVLAAAKLPVVTGVDPPSGSVFSLVVITGNNFDGAREVDFGPRRPAFFIKLCPTVILALAPPNPPGTVYVTVRTRAGTSAASSASQFRYRGWGF